VTECIDCKYWERPASRLSPSYCHLVLPPMLRSVIGSNMILTDQYGCSFGKPKEADRG